MLLRLLKTFLERYKGPLALVVVLQFVQTIAALYLPSLNADIIDKGVAHRRHRLHLAHRRADARASRWSRSCFAIVAVYFGSRAAMGFGRDVRSRPVPPGHRLLGAGGRPVRRAVADHPHHQRRAAGADARADDVHAARRRADHDRRRRDHGAARGRRAVVRSCSCRVPAARASCSASSSRGWCRSSA